MLLSLLSGLPSAALAAVVTGQVVRVQDGDTLSLRTARGKVYKVRIQGIDAPEMAQRGGAESRRQLAALVMGRQVQVEWRETHSDRLVGKVELPSGRCWFGNCGGVDVGLAQLRSGQAWWYRQYWRRQRGQDADTYRQAEREARRRRLGLWADARPTPPWTWRHTRYPY